MLFEDDDIELYDETIDDDDDERILLEHNTHMNDAEEGDRYDLQQRINRVGYLPSLCEL